MRRFRFGTSRRADDGPTDPDREVDVATAIRRGVSAVGQVVGERFSPDDPDLLHPGERFAGMEVGYEEYRDVTGRLADVRFRASVAAVDGVLARRADLSVPTTFVPSVDASEVRAVAGDAVDLLTALRDDGRRNRERLSALGGDPSGLPSVDEETFVETVEALEDLSETETVDDDRVADVFGDALALLYDSADVRRTEARRQQKRGVELMRERDDAGEVVEPEREPEAEQTQGREEEGEAEARTEPGEGTTRETGPVNRGPSGESLDDVLTDQLDGAGRDDEADEPEREEGGGREGDGGSQSK